MNKRAGDRLSRVPEGAMLFIAGVMVLTIAFFSYQSIRKRAAANQQFRIAFQIENGAGELISALKDAETGQRGFILTGREDYLGPYNSALRVIPGIQQRLRISASGAPDLASRVDSLDGPIAAKLQELAKTIELRRAKGLGVAQELVETDRGRALMDEIRRICAAVQDITHRRAEQFSAEAQQSAERLGFVSIAGSLLLFLFLGLSAITIFRGMTRRDELYGQAVANASLLKVTLTSIGDAVIAINVAGKLTFINPEAQTLTGWSEESAIGASVPEVFHIVNETTRLPAPNPLEKALSDGVVVGLANHTVLIAKDGRETPIDDSSAPIRDAENRIVGAVLVFRNISVRREAERRLTESNEQLKQFVNAAAHDLRSPLNSVNVMAELMRERFSGHLGGEGTEILKLITDGLTRMSSLLNDLLAYAQASHFDRDEHVCASLDHPLRAALENLKTEVQASRAVVMASPLPVVAAHETHLVQIFQNLIGNAIKYRDHRDPSISIYAEEKDTECIVRIKDNGIGIPSEYTEDIFKPFKRLHGDNYPGSGIGLATCQKIIVNYGGKIWVDSEVGKGSIFSFTLPKPKGVNRAS